MEHFEKVIYLISLFLPVMVFFALGLWLSWFKWFKDSQLFHEAMEEHTEIVEKLNSLYTKQASVSERLEQLPTKSIIIEEQSNEGVINRESEVEFLKAQLREMELDQDRSADEIVSLRKENSELKQKLNSVADTYHNDTFSGIGMVEAILNDFADELVTNDPKLGILFQEEPDIVDDLLAIDILSPRIATRLNELGVYRYRQISLWSEDQFDLIIEKIGIDPNQVIGKNGIWQRQAAQLHRKNY